MTKKILGYALIFVTLFALYQFVNTNRLYDKMNGKIEKARAERDALKVERDIKKDSIDLLINQNLDLSYFSLEGNGEALEYFEKYQFEGDLSQHIRDVIYDQNLAGKDNPLVPYDGMDGNFAIDKVKVINHKWVLCSFTDGGYWGEVILSYEIDKDKNLSFETIVETLYPKYQK